MKQILKIVMIAVPALTLIAGIGLIGVMAANKISLGQVLIGFRSYAGLRPSSVGATFVVTLLPMGGGSAEQVDCGHLNCPAKEMEEITRRYFGSNFPPTPSEDANGQLTDAYVDQIVSWKKEMNRAVLRHLPAEYMDYVPVDIGLDTKSQTPLRILIWLVLVGAVISAVAISCWLAMNARSGRRGEVSEEDDRNTAKVDSFGSYLK